MAKAPKKTTKNGKKSAVRGIAVLLICFLGILLLLLFLLFTGHPRYPVPELTPGDWSFQANLLMRELPRILRSEPGELATLRLTPEEVNSVLRFAANGGNLAAMFQYTGALSAQNGTLPFRASYDQGELDVAYAHDTGIPLLMGGFFPVRLRGRPELENGKLRILPSAARLGRIPVGATVADLIIRNALAQMQGHEAMEKFLAVVERIKVDDSGNLELVYRPYELNRQIFKRDQ